MNNKLALLFTVLTGSLAALAGQAQTPNVPPSPGGQASHIELLNNNTPQQKAEAKRQEIALQQSSALNDAGEKRLEQQQFPAAEDDFREALRLFPGIPAPYAGLADALEDQGRFAEALDTYRTLFTYPSTISSTVQETRTRMGYAIALSQAGQWEEAVALYEKTIPSVPNDGDTLLNDIHFDSDVPMPDQLQSRAYVARGLENLGHGQYKRAFLNFTKAVHADSSSALANYYYGYSWGDLDSKDKQTLGGKQQARAALHKAVKLGKGPVKLAAQKALQVAINANPTPKPRTR